MLSVPTLWTVFAINFLAVGMVWAYVMRSYPKFDAARFWALAALSVALGSLLSVLRGVTDPTIPIIVGNGLMIAASCFAEMGIKRFYGRPISWRLSAGITAVTCAGLTFFLLAYDSIAIRTLVYSAGQAIPIIMTLPLVLARDNPGARNPGERNFSARNP